MSIRFLYNLSLVHVDIFLVGVKLSFLMSLTPRKNLFRSKISFLFVNFPMFPQDLPSIPPDWQVEFSIDLVPRVSLIVKISYHLTSAEIIRDDEETSRIA